MRLEDVVGAVPSWFADAACLGMPSEPFFPEGRGTSPRAAQAVCAECVVRDQCAAYAAAEGFEVGVFGGVNRARRGRHERTPA